MRKFIKNLILVLIFSMQVIFANEQIKNNSVSFDFKKYANAFKYQIFKPIKKGFFNHIAAFSRIPYLYKILTKPKFLEQQGSILAKYYEAKPINNNPVVINVLKTFKLEESKVIVYYSEKYPHKANVFGNIVITNINPNSESFEFAIGHELVHMIHNDLQNRDICSIGSTIGYFALIQMLQYLFVSQNKAKSLPKKIVNKSLNIAGSAAVSLVLSYINRIIFSKYQENRSDIVSIKKLNCSKEAIRFFEDLKKYHVSMIKQREDLGIVSLDITKDGDYLMDLDHPVYSARIKQAESIHRELNS